ncbi:hypothetical protein [Salinifilum ghardaiensis]
MLYFLTILLQALGADRPMRLFAGLVAMALLSPMLFYLNRRLRAHSDQPQAES